MIKAMPKVDWLAVLSAAHGLPTPGGARGGESKATPLDAMRAESLVLEQLQQLRGLMVNGFVRPQVEHVTSRAWRDDGDGDEAPMDRRGEALVALLRQAQMLLLAHPAAAQAAFSALVAEGRRFAEVPEGRAWADRLASSELLQRARRVWDSTTLGMLREEPDAGLPSAFVEILAESARRDDLEAVLRRFAR